MAQKYRRGSPGKATKQGWCNLGALPGDSIENTPGQKDTGTSRSASLDANQLCLIAP